MPSKSVDRKIYSSMLVLQSQLVKDRLELNKISLRLRSEVRFQGDRKGQLHVIIADSKDITKGSARPKEQVMMYLWHESKVISICGYKNTIMTLLNTPNSSCVPCVRS